MSKLIIFFLGIVLTTCQSPVKYVNYKVINVPDLTDNENLSIFDYFSRVELVPLETSPKCMIKKVSKLICSLDRYYVLDEDQAILFIFDSYGKYLSSINKRGNGPGEYAEIYDFKIEMDKVEILDPAGKIIEYDYDGNFLKTYRLPFRAADLLDSVNKDTLVLYRSFAEKRINFYSKSSAQILNKTYKRPETLSRIYSTGRNPFYHFNDTLHFFSPYDNNIYYIDDMELNIKYQWNFGKYNLKIKDIPERLPSDNQSFIKYVIKLKEDINSKFVNDFKYIIETDQYILTSISFKKYNRHILYDKRTGKSNIFVKTKEGVIFYYPTLFEDGIASCINPDKIQLLAPAQVLDEKNQNTLKNIEIDDNPLIVKYYFK